MSSKPNVFTYATNELSQDAIICYMLEWAIKENESIDKEMHQVGKKFLSSLFEKCGKKLEDYETLEISKQEEKIDVLCIVDRKYHIITPPINNLNYVIILDGKNRRKKIITKRVV